MNEKLLAEITEILTGVCGESYHNWNGSDSVIYPYLTFDFDSAPADGINQDNVELTLDLFDHTSSWRGLVRLEDALRDKLTALRYMTDDFNMIFSYLGAVTVPVPSDPDLKHRNVRYNIKLDWRTKQWHS